MNLQRFALPGMLVTTQGTSTMLRENPKNMIGVAINPLAVGIVVATRTLETAPDDWSTEVRLILVEGRLGWVNAQELEVVTKPLDSERTLHLPNI